MSNMYENWLLPALAGLLLVMGGPVACGEEGSLENGGGGVSDDLADLTDFEYFGLVPGTCLGFERGGVELTVRVTDGHVLDEVDVLEVTYTLNEMPYRVESLRVVDGELLVVRRQDYHQNADSIFDPPYLVSSRPLQPTVGTPRRTETSAEDIRHGAEDRDWRVSVTIDQPQRREIPGREDPVDTFAHVVRHRPLDDGEERVDTFVMAPGVGFFELELEGVPVKVEFVEIWESDGPCPGLP